SCSVQDSQRVLLVGAYMEKISGVAGNIDTMNMGNLVTAFGDNAFALTDGMDPRPLIHGLVMGPGCAEQHPNKARRVRDGSYNDRDRLGKECVRGVRCG